MNVKQSKYKVVMMLIILGLLTLTFSACNLLLPSSIEIRSNPTVEVPSGLLTLNITDYIDLDETLVSPLRQAFGDFATENNGIEPVRGEVVNGVYTIYTDLALLAIRPSSFFDGSEDGIGLSETVEFEGFSLEIPDVAPSIAIDPITIEPVALPLGIGGVDPVSIPIKPEPVAIPGITLPGVEVTEIPEPGNSEPIELRGPDNEPISLTIDASEEFTLVRFAEGVLEVTLNLVNASPSLKMGITSAPISWEGSGQDIEAQELLETATVNLTNTDSSVVLNYVLNDIELPGNFSLEIIGTVEGGNLLQTFDLGVVLGFYEGTTIIAAEGIALDDIEVPSFPIESQPLSFEGFQTITFSEGKLIATVTFENIPDGLDISLSSVELQRASVASLIGIVSEPESSENNLIFDISFSLIDEVFPSALTLALDSVIGFIGNSIDLSPFYITVGFDFDETKISAATGVDLEDFNIDFTDSMTIDFPLGEELESVTIGQGSITLTLEFPEWYGVEFVFNGSISEPDSWTKVFEEDPENEGVYILDLAGVTINSSSVAQLDYSVEVIGATLSSFDLGDSFNISVDVELSTLDEVVVLTEGLDFSENIREYFEDSMITEFVEKITFSEAELILSFNNRLPVTLEFELVSSVLLSETHLDLLSETEFSANPNIDIEPANNLVRIRFEPAEDEAPVTVQIPFVTEIVIADLPEGIPENGTEEFPYLDISIAATPLGYEDGKLTLTNVNLNQNLSFSGSVGVEMALASVDLQNITQDIAFPEEGGEPIDFSVLNDFLPPEITIPDITGFIILSGPSDLAGEILAIARYTDNSSEEPVQVVEYLIGSNDGETDVPFRFSEGDPIPIDAIGTIINARPADLQLEFSVTIDAIEINFETDAELAVNLNLELPLRLAVDDQELRISWNPLPDTEPGDPLFTPETDLFNRESDNGQDDGDIVQELLNSLSEVVLSFNLVNETGLDAIYVVIEEMENPDDTNQLFSRKEISFASGKHDLVLSTDDVRFIRDVVPFQPEIFLELEGGRELGFNPEGELSISLWVTVGANIKYPISLSGNN